MSLTEKDIIMQLGASMQAAAERMKEMQARIDSLEETNAALSARLEAWETWGRETKR